MRLSRIFTLAFLTIPIVFSAASAEEGTEGHDMVITDGVVMGKFTHDYDAALSHAKEKGLPIILVFTGSDWCGWCKTMDRNVFTKPEWEAYAKEAIVQVWLDYPRNKDLVPEKYRERNAVLKGEYGIRGYPTYIILDSNGDQVGKLGAGRDKTPESFKTELEKVLIMTESGMKAHVKKMKAEDAAQVISAYKAHKAADSVVVELEKKLDVGKEIAADKKDELEAAMEVGKVNAMSEEDKAAYGTAKADLAEAQKNVEVWMRKNARASRTPELTAQYEELKEAVDAAERSISQFDL